MYAFRRKFGMSFQDAALFDSMTVFENIAFPIRRHERSKSKTEVKKRVDECLDLVGMPTIGSLMPSECSGGMKRRVGFARAIALKPEILLFDEPTTGLDPIMTTVIDNEIVHLREELKATTITITHDLASADRVATRVAMLFDGNIIHEDAKEEFFKTKDPMIRQFLDGAAEGPMTQSLLK